MNSQKLLVHSSTHPHYVEGAETVIADESIESKGEYFVTHSEHETLCLPWKKTNVSFVTTVNPINQELRRIAD